MAAPSPVQSSRNLRGFLRWMRDNNVEYSAGLSFHIGDSVADIGVKARVDLHEGEMIATIPKQACLTIITSEAETMISEAELGGGLGLVVALMYERSLGELSKWDGYLRLVPFQQCLPMVWSLTDIDRLLTGTELHKVVKEDRRLMKSDWKECYGILVDLFGESKFPAKWFSFEHYLAAKTLVASRAFQVDDVHGYGMVPLADLFNHKTGAEDVHFTSVFSDSDSDSEEHEPSTPDSADETLDEATKRGRKFTSSVGDRNNLKEATKEMGKSNNGINRSPKPREATKKKVKSNIGVDDSPKSKKRGKSNLTVDESPEISKEAIMKREKFAAAESPKPKEVAYKRKGKPNSIEEVAEPAKESDPGAEEDDALGLPSNWEESSEVLEMIMVKDVAKGTEIYNTYGLLSNAALLHRYGFTEPDNPFDIINVDLALVIHVCGGLSSKRHVRRCLTLWRQAGCAPCSSQGTEYFEFSVDGKPQSELLLLLYLIHAPDATRDNVEQQALHWNADEVELSDDEEIERVSSAAVDKLAKALGWTTKLKNSSSRKRSRDGLANGTPNGSNTRRMTPQRTSILPRKEDSSCLTDFDKWLLTKSVCSSLLAIVAERDSIYPEVRSMTSEKLGGGSLSSTLQDDRELLKTRDRDIDPMLYHALSLRIGERTILDKCATLMKIKSKKR